jgi:hypothetical protein
MTIKLKLLIIPQAFSQSLRSTQLQTTTSTTIPALQPVQPSQPAHPIQNLPQQPKTQESKAVQIQKPLYDGYLIAPGAFDDMLNANAENEQLSATSAQAHFSSTQHLRDAQKEAHKRQSKRETYTMTDNLNMADPIAPDILFKLHFDSSRKDRQTTDENTAADSKDYVNVVDLDSNDVDNLLKLIEHEQNRRQGKFVSVSPRKPKVVAAKEEVLEDTGVDLIPDKDEEPRLRADALTERILATSKEEWREYDQIMEQQIKEATRLAGGSINRQRAANELKFIDDKIKLMNEMAGEMDSDYAKYSKIVGEVQSLTRQRELIERYQDEQRMEEKKKARQSRDEQREKVRFYERKEADDQIGDLKKKIVKSKAENKIKIKPMSADEMKKSKLSKKQLDLVSFEDDDDELSDLKESEQAKLKNILKDSTSFSLAKKDDSLSVTNILKDVFDEMNVDTIEDLDSDKIDELLDRSAGVKGRPASKSVPKRVEKPLKSPIRSRKELNKRTTSPVKPLNKTFEKMQRKVSPIVNIEREMSEKRDVQSENFAHQREEDAKKLLRELLVDSAEVADLAKRRKSPSSSPMSSRKHKSPAKPTMPTLVPSLSLSLQHGEAQTIENRAQPKKPSLMAQTMIKMKENAAKKSVETERLLRDLEQRAQQMEQKPRQAKTVSKKIKPFTSFVRLQDPNRLRAKREHEPLTYGQQLKLHQETTVEPEPMDENELFKLFGTHRVKGHFDGYVKSTPRKVKTYAERLRELKPAQSQARAQPWVGFRSGSDISAARNRSSSKIRQTKTYGQTLKELQRNKATVEVGRHSLQTKTRVGGGRVGNKQRRFEPYKTGDTLEGSGQLEDLSSWSLDEQMRDIIYDDEPARLPPKLKAKKKKVVIKDADEDTLADIDGDYLLENLLEDEKRNEKTFQGILNDLSNIERKEKELKGESFVEEDYVNQVNLDDLRNISLSSESAISSFIDWDQIDNLINTLK